MARTDEIWIEEILGRYAEEGLARGLVTYAHAGPRVKLEGSAETLLNFSSNDYLTLASDPRVIEAGREAYSQFGSAASSSRLVTGTLAVHDFLEQRLCQHLAFPAALVCGSGYLANLSAVSALVGRDDFIIADKLVHASLVDGSVLSRAKLERFRHNDLDHAEQLLRNVQARRGKKRKCLLITESVFSMDGDLAPLQELSRLCAQYDAMFLVDEAHAIGVFGEAGRGRVYAEGLEVTVVTGTLSKALASYGGFILCSPLMKRLFVNRARPFIYNTAIPPAQAASAIGALQILNDEPLLGKEVLERARLFYSLLGDSTWGESNALSQIIPVVIGDNAETLKLARELLELSVLVVAIREPTVPRGTARLRFSINRGHSVAEIELTASVLKKLLEKRSPDQCHNSSSHLTPSR